MQVVIHARTVGGSLGANDPLFVQTALFDLTKKSFWLRFRLFWRVKIAKFSS